MIGKLQRNSVGFCGQLRPNHKTLKFSASVVKCFQQVRKKGLGWVVGVEPTTLTFFPSATNVNR